MTPTVPERYLALRYTLSYLNPVRALRIARRVRGGRPSDTDASVRLVFTSDIEYTPPWIHGGWEYESRGRGMRKGVRNLLRLLSTAKVTGTFLVEGVVAKNDPDVVRDILAAGHEVGYHGWAHESYGGRWRTKTAKQPTILNAGQVRSKIAEGKAVIGDIVGSHPTSFVAPFHHVRRSTLQALIDEGFTVDSSVYNHCMGTYEPFFIKSGSGRILEVPFSIPFSPRWRLYSPFFPTILDLVSSSELSAVEEVRSLSHSFPGQRRELFLLLTCHPWEFAEEGSSRLMALSRLVNRVLSFENCEVLRMNQIPARM